MFTNGVIFAEKFFLTTKIAPRLSHFSHFVDFPSMEQGSDLKKKSYTSIRGVVVPPQWTAIWPSVVA